MPFSDPTTISLSISFLVNLQTTNAGVRFAPPTYACDDIFCDGRYETFRFLPKRSPRRLWHAERSR